MRPRLYTSTFNWNHLKNSQTNNANATKYAQKAFSNSVKTICIVYVNNLSDYHIHIHTYTHTTINYIVAPKMFAQTKPRNTNHNDAAPRFDRATRHNGPFISSGDGHLYGCPLIWKLYNYNPTSMYMYVYSKNIPNMYEYIYFNSGRGDFLAV